MLPAGPVECGCARHYKHSVISSVIPMPLELCFELLFSGTGAGQGDKLGCDTHRCKDGSTDIKITPWRSPSSLTSVDSIARKWSDEKRHLEYSVSFKVPMLAKTSTACFETQQVTEYSDFIILVHSESRTPNVPYGEHFSTVNQICMTWDSPGSTKIQCFTEVKFKKSIMWSGKVEAGSLEGSGGFYKELIRQLSELAGSPQGAALVEKAAKLNTKAVTVTEVTSQRASNAAFGTSSLSTVSTTATLQMEPAISPLSITNNPATPIPIQSPIPYSPGGAILTMEPVEMSRAQSLFSQQILRSQAHPLTLTLPLKSGTRASMDSGPRPKFEEVSTNDSTLSTPEKKSQVSTFIQSLTSPVFPVLGVIGYEQVVSNSAASGPAIGSPDTKPSTPTLPVTLPSAQTLLELLKRGRMPFNKSPSATAFPITFRSVSIDNPGSLASLQPKILTSPLTNAHSSPLRLSGNRVKFASTNYHTQGPINNEQHHNTQVSATKALSGSAVYQDRGSRFLSKTLFYFLVMGMAITALNVWSKQTCFVLKSWNYLAFWKLRGKN
ncbi:hypothetical protein BG003_005811 [Podila horticola]|nr:hypothetical protein BG003_005811 [Podila horticola]